MPSFVLCRSRNNDSWLLSSRGHGHESPPVEFVRQTAFRFSINFTSWNVKPNSWRRWWWLLLLESQLRFVFFHAFQQIGFPGELHGIRKHHGSQLVRFGNFQGLSTQLHKSRIRKVLQQLVVQYLSITMTLGGRISRWREELFPRLTVLFGRIQGRKFVLLLLLFLNDLLVKQAQVTVASHGLSFSGMGPGGNPTFRCSTGRSPIVCIRLQAGRRWKQVEYAFR